MIIFVSQMRILSYILSFLIVFTLLFVQVTNYETLNKSEATYVENELEEDEFINDYSSISYVIRTTKILTSFDDINKQKISIEKPPIYILLCKILI